MTTRARVQKSPLNIQEQKRNAQGHGITTTRGNIEARRRQMQANFKQKSRLKDLNIFTYL